MRIFGRDHRQPKRFMDGTHRARSPAETFADFGRHQQAMGITRLANVTGLDVIGIPVYMAVRPSSRSIAVSQGKGLDREAPHGYTPTFPRSSNGLASGNHLLEAIVHALCELIERDAMALWYAEEEDDSAKATQVDPATIDDDDAGGCCRE